MFRVLVALHQFALVGKAQGTRWIYRRHLGRAVRCLHRLNSAESARQLDAGRETLLLQRYVLLNCETCAAVFGGYHIFCFTQHESDHLDTGTNAVECHWWSCEHVGGRTGDGEM